MNGKSNFDLPLSELRVAVVGTGLMGSQIACEYALAGARVTSWARDVARTTARIADVLALVADAGLASGERVAAARARTDVLDASAPLPTVDLVVESLPEDLELKARVLAPALAALPDATLATNTSSLRIADLGEAVGAPERTVGTHYWNPPLLMPLVEVVAGERTDPARVERQLELLALLGKRPLRVRRDVPGFVWNRLQHALVREAMWLVREGVAAPADVDAAMRLGLARRSRLTGPFETVALAGPEMFEQVAENLFPRLSAARRADGLATLARERADELDLDALRAARDDALVAELRAERAAATDDPER